MSVSFWRTFIQSIIYQSKTVVKKWIDVFKVLENNLEEIPCGVSTVVVSNAFTDTVFSLMEKLWTDERNKMSIELVKAELCVSINYGMNCLVFPIFGEAGAI